MSWPLAAYGLLAIALLAGFVWYERGKPDAKIVALVGTLAALAALGRIAFAAVPNVKPTTDIVLISGYALGGPPGFVVGAVAALTSNFFFGQGPWTPWQMAGWGATGLIGAGLAVVTRHRIRRIPLAAVCFPIGFAFTALQDVGDWVAYSDHSLAQLGVYVGKGIGFDLVHAVGCVAFALAFGPALIHSLSRFRLRLDVNWVPPALIPLLLLTALFAPLHAAPARADASPVTYLLSAQNRDGGFGAAPGQPSSPLFSGWAALALAAAGEHPSGLLAYLGGHPGSDPGSLERSILAIRALGGSVSALSGRLRHDIRRDGSIADQTNLTAFAILALVDPPPRSVAWLARQQDADGGFNFATRGGQSDVDDTGAVLEALARTGDAGTVARAVRFLDRHENRDGGFPSLPGSPSNAQSTAFAVQGLIAAGRDPGRGQAYLRRLIAPDGHVAYARGQNQTPVWVTAQAELALAGRALPIAPLRAVVVVPVAHKPPARTVRHRTVRHARAPRGHRAAHGRQIRVRPVPDLRPLSADAGVLVALALAPVGV